MKTIIIENQGFLKLRLEKILEKHSRLEIEALNSNLITDTYLKYIIDQVSLFIIDIDATDYDGLSLINTVHNLVPVNPVPIIALSKNANISLLKKAVILGCNDFILKPFSDEDVIYKVKALLHMKEENSKEQLFNFPHENNINEVNLTWAKDFEIQIPKIDAEHKAIILKYISLYKLMKEGKGHQYYSELLEFLNDYVETHFSHEEQMHESKNFPLKTEHKRIHTEFKSNVQQIYNAGKTRSITDKDLINISLFIKNWLIHHILIEDRKFGDYIKN